MLSGITLLLDHSSENRKLNFHRRILLKVERRCINTRHVNDIKYKTDDDLMLMIGKFFLKEHSEAL